MSSALLEKIIHELQEKGELTWNNLKEAINNHPEIKSSKDKQQLLNEAAHRTMNI
jgi:hypothetical protein